MPCSSLYTHFRCSWLLCSMYSNWPQMLNSEPWTEPNWHQKNQATSFTPMSISDVPQEIWSSKTGLLWSAKISPPGVLSLDFPALLSSLLTELCLFAPLAVSFPSSSCWWPFQLVLSDFTSSPPVSSRLGSCAPPDSWLVNCKGPWGELWDTEVDFWGSKDVGGWWCTFCPPEDPVLLLCMK